jgi:hypothetical protein
VKRKAKEETGPREGDFIPPVPGGDGKWRRVVLVMHGRVMAVEVWHGDPPPEKPPVKKKPPPPAWKPAERNPLEMSPVVEKFLSWRYATPAAHPPVRSLTRANLDRLVRMVMVGKRSNWYADWGKSWSGLSRAGATDDELMKIIWQEVGASGLRRPHDKRRAFVRFYRKGKGAVLTIGAADDPDQITLEGADLVVAVRRAMNIKRNF